MNKLTRSLLALTMAIATSAQVDTSVAGENPTSNKSEFVTQWQVTPSLGLDTVLFIGALTGDKLQSSYYEEDIAYFRALLDEGTNQRLDRLGAMSRERGVLVGPALALAFSAGPLENLDQLITSATDPVSRLKPNYQASVYWNDRQWEVLEGQVLPQVLAILQQLKQVGFEEYWTESVKPTLDKETKNVREYLAAYDIIPEQQRLLARPLDPEINVMLLHFNKPYGIRIIGQRYVSHHSWDAEDQLRVAAHEIFHPPWDQETETRLMDSLAELRDDPWMHSIVHDHDPSFGYNSFNGVVNEDSTTVLDQIVSERLGFARDPATRWREVDGGMHMLAAALYQLAKEDGYDERGGDYAAWLQSVVDRGLLNGDDVRRRATLLVGDQAVAAWWPDAVAQRKAAENSGNGQ